MGEMEYVNVTIKLEYGVLERIRKAGLRTGLTVEEVIRAELGQLHADMPTVQAFAIEPSAQRTDGLAFYAKIMSSTGQVKCRSCSRQLTSDEILKGECQCGEKL